MRLVVRLGLFLSIYRCKPTVEAIHGLMSQVIKDRIFNHAVRLPSNPSAEVPAEQPMQASSSEAS